MDDPTPLETSKPRFVNGCKKCVFLGQHGSVDLWYCASLYHYVVVYLEDERFESFPMLMGRAAINQGASKYPGSRFPDFAEALRRADELGLVKEQ
jgi:hypothetical protein